MAEGAPLLREYGVYSPIKGSNPFDSASTQLERAPDADHGARFHLYKRCLLDQRMSTRPCSPMPVGGLPVTAADAIFHNCTSLFSFTSQ